MRVAVIPASVSILFAIAIRFSLADTNFVLYESACDGHIINTWNVVGNVECQPFLTQGSHYKIHLDDGCTMVYFKDQAPSCDHVSYHYTSKQTTSCLPVDQEISAYSIRGCKASTQITETHSPHSAVAAAVSLTTPLVITIYPGTAFNTVVTASPTTSSVPNSTPSASSSQSSGGLPKNTAIAIGVASMTVGFFALVSYWIIFIRQNIQSRKQHEASTAQAEALHEETLAMTTRARQNDRSTRTPPTPPPRPPRLPGDSLSPYYENENSYVSPWSRRAYLGHYRRFDDGWIQLY